MLAYRLVHWPRKVDIEDKLDNECSMFLLGSEVWLSTNVNVPRF